jgi:predicted MFS family arabinose efflux permease
MSASPSYAILLAAGLVAGVGQAGANPATNKLIGLHVPSGRRGLVTGVKQSGVQAGLFVGGLVIPGLALAFGWRTALALVVSAPAVGIIVTSLIVPRDEPASLARLAKSTRRAPLPAAINWIAGQGILVGAAAAALITYLPLFVDEEAGFSVTMAGAVASIYGLGGLFARLVFPTFGERSKHLAYPMLLVVSLAVMGTVLVWLGPTWSVVLLWIGAALVGSLVAWTALAMLAVVTLVDQHQAGRASGIVARGFGIGLAAGPPIFGFSVDTTGHYDTGFAFLIATMIGAAILIALWLRSDAPTD